MILLTLISEKMNMYPQEQTTDFNMTEENDNIEMSFFDTFFYYIDTTVENKMIAKNKLLDYQVRNFPINIFQDDILTFPKLYFENGTILDRKNTKAIFSAFENSELFQETSTMSINFDTDFIKVYNIFEQRQNGLSKADGSVIDMLGILHSVINSNEDSFFDFLYALYLNSLLGTAFGNFAVSNGQCKKILTAIYHVQDDSTFHIFQKLWNDTVLLMVKNYICLLRYDKAREILDMAHNHLPKVVNTQACYEYINENYIVVIELLK